MEDFVEIDGRTTWFRTTGERRSGSPALIVLHGGPGGCSPDGIRAIDVIARDRLVVEYDQLDCGRSQRVNDPSRWTVEGHVAELDSLRRALDLDEVHLWGMSWGGMLAAAYVLAHRDGVRSVTLASSPISAPAWVASAERLRAGLPASTLRAMERCERALLRRPATARAGATAPTSQVLRRRAAALERMLSIARRPTVQAAARAMSHVPAFARTSYPILGIEFLDRHIARAGAVNVDALVGQTGMNPAVYETMWGPSEHLAVGPLRTFDLTDRLGEIDVPVLVTSGDCELLTPDAGSATAAALPRGEYHLFEGCAHAAPLEDPERYAAVLQDFLRRADTANR